MANNQQLRLQGYVNIPRMAIQLMSEAKVWVVAITLLVLAGLRSDVAEAQFLIVYIGNWPESQDPVYERLGETLRERHPALFRSAKMQHLKADVGDNAGMETVVRAALARNPTLLVTTTGRSSRVAARLAGKVPIVFASSTDPVLTGIRSSLQFSQNAITGVSLADWLDEKRLEILRDAFPGVREVAVLSERAWTDLYDVPARMARISVALGLNCTLVYAENNEELDALMRSAEAKRFDAWYIPPTYVAYGAEDRIIEHLRRLQKPAMHSSVGEARRGGLMAYEQDADFVFEAMSDLIARICAGEFAGSIPVQTPQLYRLAVRTDGAGTALHVDPSVVRRADQVF